MAIAPKNGLGREDLELRPQVRVKTPKNTAESLAREGITTVISRLSSRLGLDLRFAQNQYNPAKN